MFPPSVSKFLNEISEQNNQKSNNKIDTPKLAKNYNLKHYNPDKFNLLKTFRRKTSTSSKPFEITCIKSFALDESVVDGNRAGSFVSRENSEANEFSSQDKVEDFITLVGTSIGLVLIFGVKDLIDILDCKSDLANTKFENVSAHYGCVSVLSVDYFNEEIAVACDNGIVQIWKYSKAMFKEKSNRSIKYLKDIFYKPSNIQQKLDEMQMIEEDSGEDACNMNGVISIIVKWIDNCILALACDQELYVVQLNSNRKMFKRKTKVSNLVLGKIVDIHISHVEQKANLTSKLNIMNRSSKEDDKDVVLIGIATAVRFVIMSLNKKLIRSIPLQLNVVSNSEILLDSLDPSWMNKYGVSSRHVGRIPLPYFDIVSIHGNQNIAEGHYYILAWGRFVVILRISDSKHGYTCKKLLQYEISNSISLFSPMVIGAKWLTSELACIIVSLRMKEDFFEGAHELHLLDPHYWISKGEHSLSFTAGIKDPKYQGKVSVFGQVLPFSKLAEKSLFTNNSNTTPVMKRVIDEENGKNKFVYVATSMRKRESIYNIESEIQSRMSSSLISDMGPQRVLPAPSYHSHIDFFDGAVHVVTNTWKSNGNDSPAVEGIILTEYKQKIRGMVANQEWDNVFQRGQLLMQGEERGLIGLQPFLSFDKKKCQSFVKTFFSNILLQFAFLSVREINQLNSRDSNNWQAFAKKCITFSIRISREDLLYTLVYDIFQSSTKDSDIEVASPINILGRCLIEEILAGNLKYMDHNKLHWFIDLVSQDWKVLENLLLRVSDSYKSKEFAMKVIQLGRDLGFLNLYVHSVLMMKDPQFYKEGLKMLKEHIEGRVNMQQNSAKEEISENYDNSIYLNVSLLYELFEKLACESFEIYPQNSIELFQLVSCLTENEKILLQLIRKGSRKFFTLLRNAVLQLFSSNYDKEIGTIMLNITRSVLRCEEARNFNNNTSNSANQSVHLFICMMSDLLVNTPSIAQSTEENLLKDPIGVKLIFCHKLHQSAEHSSIIYSNVQNESPDVLHKKLEDSLIHLINLLQDELLHQVFNFESIVEELQIDVDSKDKSILSLTTYSSYNNEESNNHQCNLCGQTILACSRDKQFNNLLVNILNRTGNKQLEVEHISSRILLLQYAQDVEDDLIDKDTHLLLAFQQNDITSKSSPRSVFQIINDLFSHSKSFLSALYLEEFMHALLQAAKDKSCERGTLHSTELKEIIGQHISLSKVHRAALQASALVLSYELPVTVSMQVKLQIENRKLQSEKRLLTWIKTFEKEIEKEETLSICQDIPSATAYLHSISGRSADVICNITKVFEKKFKILCQYLENQVTFSEASLQLRLEKIGIERSKASKFDCQYVCFVISKSKKLRHINTDSTLGLSRYRFADLFETEGFMALCKANGIPTPRNFDDEENFITSACESNNDKDTIVPPVYDVNGDNPHSILKNPYYISLNETIIEAKDYILSLTDKKKLLEEEARELWFTLLDQVFLYLRSLKYGLLHEDTPKISRSQIAWFDEGREAQLQKEMEGYMNELQELNADLQELEDEEEREIILEQVRDLTSLVEIAKRRIVSNAQIKLIKERQATQIAQLNEENFTNMNKLMNIQLQHCLSHTIKQLLDMLSMQVDITAILQRIIAMHSLDPFFFIRTVVLQFYDVLNNKKRTLQIHRHFSMCDSFEMSTQILNHSKRAIRWRQNERCGSRRYYCCTLCGDPLLNSMQKVQLWKCGHIIHTQCIAKLSQLDDSYTLSCPICRDGVRGVVGQHFEEHPRRSLDYLIGKFSQIDNQFRSIPELREATNGINIQDTEIRFSSYSTNADKSKWISGDKLQRSSIKEDSLLTSLLRS